MLANAAIQANGCQSGSNGKPDTGKRLKPGDDGQEQDEADCLVSQEDKSGKDQEYQRQLQGDRPKCREQEDCQHFAQGRFDRKAPRGYPRALSAGRERGT